MDIIKQLMTEVRSLTLKLDTTLAEVRVIKAIALGGRTTLEAAVRSQRRMIQADAQRELEGFERSFLRATDYDCTAAMLRSTNQAAEAVFHREAFAWLVEHHIRHLGWATVAAYLGRDPSGLYRAARRMERRRLDIATDERMKLIERRLKDEIERSEAA
jgi:hypothetical protein